MRTTIIALLISLGGIAAAGCGNAETGGGESTASSTAGAESAYYTCPMHPSVVLDKPGSCPVCGMALVRRSGTPEKSPGDIDVLRSLKLSPTQRVIANVSTTVAVREAIDREITTVGVVDYAEPLRTKAVARFSGRIERLHVDYTGTKVVKGQPLFELYSPDLYSAAREFVLALNAAGDPGSPANPDRRAMVDAARDRLTVHFGLTPDQVASVESTRVVPKTVAYHSPISGTVLDKLVQEGQYVDPGMVLYDLADLSRVWIHLDVYEMDVRFIAVGHHVRIRTASYPGETFHGVVTFISPVLDPSTRTVRVRTEFDNASARLKPQMFVEAAIHVPADEAVVVPASAVLYTGARNIAWVEVGENAFEPREVRVGAESGGMAEILEGLEPGDRVVTSGGYLIESESQLRAPAAGGGAHGHGGRDPAPARDEHEGHPGGRQ